MYHSSSDVNGFSVLRTTAPMPSKVDRAWKHLFMCPEVSEAVRLEAQHWLDSEKLRKAAKAISTFAPRHTPLQSALPMLNTASSMPSPSTSPFPSTPRPLSQASSLHSLSNDWSSTASTSFSFSSSTPSRSTGLADFDVINDLGPVHLETAPPTQAWAAEKQAEFAADLCRLMIMCNMAWWNVEQPYWRFFFSKWLPEAAIPGRRELSGRILDEEAGKIVTSMKDKVHRRYGTGQCDAWKNIVKASIIASMVNVEYIVS